MSDLLPAPGNVGKLDSENMGKDQGKGGAGKGGRDEDVTTPAAARARAALINTSYVPEVCVCIYAVIYTPSLFHPFSPQLRTPLFTKTPSIPLQRAVLFSTTKKTTPHTPYTVKRYIHVRVRVHTTDDAYCVLTYRTQTLRTDDTVLHGDIERVASTPEGLILYHSCSSKATFILPIFRTG